MIVCMVRPQIIKSILRSIAISQPTTAYLFKSAIELKNSDKFYIYLYFLRKNIDFFVTRYRLKKRVLDRVRPQTPEAPLWELNNVLERLNAHYLGVVEPLKSLSTGAIDAGKWWLLKSRGGGAVRRLLRVLTRLNWAL